MRNRDSILIGLFITTLFNCHSSAPTEPKNGYSSCDNFPPAVGETWTYRVIGSNYIFSMTTETVAEKIGTFAVYRERRTDDPPGLGNYYGCDPSHGKVWVATDSWKMQNPRDYTRHVFETPIPVDLCPYGTKAGTVRQNTMGVGYENRTIMEVIAYEDITVPFGTFVQAQKIKVTYYDEGKIDKYEPPIFQWHDKEIGLIKELEAEPSREVGFQLVNYRPPQN